MKAYHNTAVLKFDDDTTGNAASGVPVTVRINSSQALASIFDVDDIAIGNPLTTDSNGNYAFKAADNIYDVIVSEGTANEVKIEKVEIAEIPTAPILINDLSQTYNFATVAAYKAFTTSFPDGKQIKLLDRNAIFTKITGTGTASTFDIIANNTLSESISINIKDNTIDLDSWGAGTTDDSALFNYVLNNLNGRKISGTPFKTYTIESAIINTATEGILWEANHSEVLLTSALVIEDAIFIRNNNFNVTIKNLFVDSDKKAHRGLHIRNESNVDVKDVLLEKVSSVNAYRASTSFQGGDGILIRGGYNRVTLNDCTAKNINMASGAGIPGSEGIAGITISRNFAGDLDAN